MVMLVQLICPERHCIAAGAYEEGRGTFQETCDMLKQMISPNGFLNDWCAICGSHVLKYEEGRTRFATLSEAAPFLAEQQSNNMMTRKLLDAAGLTIEKRRNN